MGKEQVFSGEKFKQISKPIERERERSASSIIYKAREEKESKGQNVFNIEASYSSYVMKY